MDIIISDHALFESKRRRIPLELIESVARSPQQVIITPAGRKICQSKFKDVSSDKTMLCRVVVIDSNNTRFVITAYITSKMDKYWEV